MVDYLSAGKAMDARDHPTHNFKDRVKLAGDVLDYSGNFIHKQMKSRMERAMSGNVDAQENLSAPVVPISPTAKRNNPVFTHGSD